jgi:hypothetical protein
MIALLMPSLTQIRVLHWLSAQRTTNLALRYDLDWSRSALLRPTDLNLQRNVFQRSTIISLQVSSPAFETLGFTVEFEGGRCRDSGVE